MFYKETDMFNNTIFLLVFTHNTELSKSLTRSQGKRHNFFTTVDKVIIFRII